MLVRRVAPRHPQKHAFGPGPGAKSKQVFTNAYERRRGFHWTVVARNTLTQATLATKKWVASLARIDARTSREAFTVRHTRTNLTWTEICTLERQRAVHGRVVAAAARGAASPGAAGAAGHEPWPTPRRGDARAAARAVVAAARLFEATQREAWSARPARAGRAPPPRPRLRRETGTVRACSGAATRAPACRLKMTRRAAARSPGARLCVRVCVDPQVPAPPPPTEEGSGRGRCAFHLSPRRSRPWPTSRASSAPGPRSRRS